MKQLILLSVILVIFPLKATATDYYVDNTNGSANNSNLGTSPSLPWATISKCVSKPLVAGDVCNVLAGSYNTRTTIGISGSAGNPITFLASPGVKTLGFTIGGSFITVQGFEIT